VLEELGIPATVIAGNANGEAHMWSCVTLNEHNYLIDVTWDDNDKDGTSTYLYFGLTTEELKKSHTPETDFAHPLCTSLAYHYYRHEGLYLEQYNFSALSAIISAQSGNAEATVKFANAAEFEKAITDLFTNGKWTSLPGFKGAVTLRYSIDEAHFILHLTFP
jgi:transglutaminase/protease-like cytokinesis protein 3